MMTNMEKVRMKSIPSKYIKNYATFLIQLLIIFRKRVYRLTEEWLRQYAWCKRYNKDPTNFFFCIYCKIPLRAASSRPKHETSAAHIAAEGEYIKRQENKYVFHFNVLGLNIVIKKNFYNF